jgi:hypothetical protein
MMSTRRGLWSLLICLSGCWTAAAASASEPTVISAHLEPEQITIGESAELTITMLGSGMNDLTLPVVSGLEFRVIEKSGRVERLHGASLATTTLTLRVTPQTAGIFTIPGITRDAEPLVLRVNRDDTLAKAGHAAGAGAPGRAGSSPLLTEEAAAQGIRLTPDGSAFMRLILPKRDFYVGESVPVEIELGARPGFVQTLNGVPTLTSGEFTLNNLKPPERSERAVAGTPFVILRWHSVLAPVKPGAFTLAAEAPITVKIRTRPAQDAKIDDLLGDPFMQNIFGPSVKKDIQVASPPVALTVLALPAADRPADFSGAVGSFRIASELSATTAAAGDPLTLRLRVTGSGNFDRVDSAMLQHLDQWKTYPPRSIDTSKPNAALEGEKVFEQPLIAARAGVQTLPGLTFSYFDPNTQRYETARTAPLSVTITAAAADAAPPAPAGVASEPATRDAADAAPVAGGATGGLRTDHAAIGGVRVASLRPLYLRPAFLAIPALLSLGFFGAWWHLEPRERARPGRPRPRDRELAKAAARALQRVQSAAAAGDPAEFFQTASAAVREGLAARWQLQPEQVTAAVVTARHAGDAAGILHLLALADETAYAQRVADEPDFARWIDVVREAFVTPGPA